MREARTEELAPATDLDRIIDVYETSAIAESIDPDDRILLLRTLAATRAAVVPIATERQKIRTSGNLTPAGRANALDELNLRALQVAGQLPIHQAIEAVDITIGGLMGRAMRGQIGGNGGWVDKPAVAPTPASLATTAEIRTVLRGMSQEERERAYIEAVRDGGDDALVDAVESTTSRALAVVRPHIVAEARRLRIAASPLAPKIAQLEELRAAYVHVRASALTELNLREKSAAE